MEGGKKEGQLLFSLSLFLSFSLSFSLSPFSLMFLYDTRSMDNAAETSNRTRCLREDKKTNRCTAVEEPLGDEENSIHIRLIPNVGTTNRCFVFDVINRKLVAGGPSAKLGRYSDRAVISNRLSFKSKVVSRYHAEIWAGEDKKVRK